MKKAQISIANLLLLLLSILILSFVVLPKYREWQAKKRENDNFAKSLESYEDYLNKVKETINYIESHTEEMEKINTILPQDPFVAEFVKFVLNSGKDNGVILTSVNYSSNYSPPLSQTPQETFSFQTLPTQFSFSFRGKYPTIKKFLEVLENSARLIDFEKMSFKSEIIFPKETEKTSSSPEEFTNLELEIKIYSLPEK